jgi:hypothetical protein
MAFSVTEDQLKGLTAGDRVSFSFRLEGGEPRLYPSKSEMAVMEVAGAQCRVGFCHPLFTKTNYSVT